MDGLSPAKQNGGRAPSDLTRMLVFLIAHFISVLILRDVVIPKEQKQPLLFAYVKSRRKSFPARSGMDSKNKINYGVVF